MGVALRDIIADYKNTVGFENLAGAAAVDANNALYQFLSIIRQPDGTPLMDRQGRVTSHLSGILFRTSTFLTRGVKPVFVFDGKPTALKQGTIDERRKIRMQAAEAWKDALERGDEEAAYRHAQASSRVDDAVITSAKELLHLLGIPVIDAPGEGEAQAAFMAGSGDVRYAVSQDYDTLLFGAPVLVRNLTVSGKRKIRGRLVSIVPERIMLADVLSGLALTREQLIQIGILVGTDFNDGIEGIGAKTGLKIVRNGDFFRKIQEKAPGFDPEPVMDIFLHPPVTTTYTLAWERPDCDGIKKMLCDGYDFSPERVDKALGGFSAKAGQKTLQEWF